MKNIRVVVLAFIAMFFITVDIMAKDIKNIDNYNKIDVMKKVFSKNNQKGVSSQDTINDYLENQNPNSISKKGDKYYILNKEITNVTSVTKSNYIILIPKPITN